MQRHTRLQVGSSAQHLVLVACWLVIFSSMNLWYKFMPTRITCLLLQYKMVIETFQHELVRLLWPNKANNSIFALLLAYQIVCQKNNINSSCLTLVSQLILWRPWLPKNTYEGNCKTNRFLLPREDYNISLVRGIDTNFL